MSPLLESGSDWIDPKRFPVARVRHAKVDGNGRSAGEIGTGSSTPSSSPKARAKVTGLLDEIDLDRAGISCG
ncbi:MAG: hypothetical protein GY788_22495 [bacterium]|nr:hypothetical protein [bacterium]